MLIKKVQEHLVQELVEEIPQHIMIDLPIPEDLPIMFQVVVLQILL